MNVKLACVHNPAMTRRGVTDAAVFLGSGCKMMELLVKVWNF